MWRFKWIKVLACALARNSDELIQMLLESEHYKLTEVLEACRYLDANRKKNEVQKKLNKLKMQGAKKRKIVLHEQKLVKVDSIIAEYDGEIPGFSLTGSKSKKIVKMWLSKRPKEELESNTLDMPTKYWKELMDLVHPNPKQLSLHWFQEYVFTKKAPKESLTYIMNSINTKDEKKIEDIIEKFKPPYVYLRLKKKITLSQKAKKIIAQYSPIDDLIWYWEDLKNSYVNEIIGKRLVEEKPEFGFGKLMERVLVMKEHNVKEIYEPLLNIANEKLEMLKIKLPANIAILGDASSSMGVAIRTSSILSCVLSALYDADLRFFRTRDQPIKYKNKPKTAYDVVKLASELQATNTTAPAASLYPYFEKKNEIGLFVVVTD
jgi:hypothetical protein